MRYVVPALLSYWVGVLAWACFQDSPVRPEVMSQEMAKLNLFAFYALATTIPAVLNAILDRIVAKDLTLRQQCLYMLITPLVLLELCLAIWARLFPIGLSPSDSVPDYMKVTWDVGVIGVIGGAARLFVEIVLIPRLKPSDAA